MNDKEVNTGMACLVEFLCEECGDKYTADRLQHYNCILCGAVLCDQCHKWSCLFNSCINCLKAKRVVEHQKKKRPLYDRL